MGFEPAAGCTGAAARVAAGKALEARLALGVDFAAVELLALGLVADDLVGRVELGKTLRGLRIVLVAVGVMLLGELAIGALDRRSAGAPLHPQDLIGVAHPSRLLHGKIKPEMDGQFARFGFIWGLSGIFATALERFWRVLTPASKALAYEFPNGHGWIYRRRPAASFPHGR